MSASAPSDEDFEALPVEERLVHKSWKARLSAYTSLITLFKQTVSESDGIFKPYINNPSKVQDWVRDSNAVSQEKGVEAAATFIEFGGKGAGRTRSEVIPHVVEKCLGSTRAGTKAKAIELCLLYVEVEEDLAEGVIADIIPGLDVKQPKVVAGSVQVLRELVRLFGPKTVSVKPILKVLPKIFAHADKTVRAEGTQLCLALHAYLGPALDAHLTELKPVQVKELNEAFAEADLKGEGFGGTKPTRWTRSQQREKKVKEAEGTLNGEAEMGGGANVVDEEDSIEVPPDPFAYAEPVEVLGALPTDFYEHLSSAKWKDRKELALEPLLNLIKVPRLHPGNYDELARALAGRMTDANVVCVALAASCLEALALGLRSDFGRYRAACLGPLLARTKEKKASVLDAIGAAADALFASTTIADVTEEFTTYAKDKNPSVKAETIKWYTRSLKTTVSPPPRAELQAIAEVLIKALEDSVEPVRISAADALGALMKVVGERALGPQIEPLDELRKAKVKEAFDRAEVKCKQGGSVKAAVVPTPAASSGLSRPKPKIDPPFLKENVAPSTLVVQSSPAPFVPKTGPPSRLTAKKPPVPSTSASATGPRPIKKPAVAAPSMKAATTKPSNEPLKYKFSQEDAEAQAENAFPSKITTGLADSVWKQRLEAITELYDWLSNGEIMGMESELVVRSLSKKPGWKESNFQVAAKMFDILKLLAERSPSFAKASAALSIPALSEKLGDMKLKKPAGDALTSYAEKTSLQFVLGEAYDPMTKQKAPKAQADSLLWVEQSIRDFGITGLAIRDLIEFLKTGLKSSNAAVRTSSTKTLVTLKLYVGADISQFIQDLNPQLLTTIESEFAKSAGDSPPEPTRSGADTIAPAASGSKVLSSKGKASEEDPLDEVFPRVDLDKLVTSAMASSCNDVNWKGRKEALEAIQSILEANKRLKPSNLTDLLSPLKLRCADANKIVQGLALDIVARIATGMGKSFDRHSRVLSAAVAGVLADQKANIRAAGITTLSAMADAAGLDPLLPGFEKPLDAANPLLRKELTSWLESRFKDADATIASDCQSIVGSVLACLEDRSSDVRKCSTAILPVLVARAGFGYVMDQTTKLKPASRSTVLPLIEAARSAAPAFAAPPPKTSTAAISAPVQPRGTALAASAMPRTAAVAKSLRAQVPTTSSQSQDEAPTAVISARSRQSLGGFKLPAPPSAETSSPSTIYKAPPFKSANPQPKVIRASKESGPLKWAVDGVPRLDQVEALHQQMQSGTSAELLERLFSKDHNSERDFAQGLTEIDDCAKIPALAEDYKISTEEMRSRLVANVDVIFKYITLRIGLTSTTITLKCLDLVDHLIPVLDAEKHKLSDYETSALLISLIQKIGDGKETVRQRVHVLLKSICSVYPFSKVFAAIMDNGLVSKNSRVREHCAEEMGKLFERHGVSPFPIAKALPALARLISDRDQAVRNAALTAIGCAYSIVGGDIVYKHIGNINDKERTMLEERLKRTPGAPPSPLGGKRSTTPMGNIGTPSKAMQRNSSDVSPAGKIVPNSKIVMPVSRLAQPLSRLPAPASPISQSQGPRQLGITRPQQPQNVRESGSGNNASFPDASTRTLSGKVSSSTGNPNLKLRQLIGGIVTDNMSECTEILKQVQKEITTLPDSIVPEADSLIAGVTQQMSLGFKGLSRSTGQTQLRLCKHLMQTLSTLFDNKDLGHAVSAGALTILLGELTGRLLDTAENPETEAISSLSKVLNMVLIRIFHHSNQTACFSALFAVLQDATCDLRELEGEDLTERAKYAELVMKCLWKVSKTVKESLESRQLSAPRLLYDINQFLNVTPPAEWRRRSADNIPLADMPLRTVKTILQQIVSLHGEHVFDELQEIESAEDSFVYQYLYRLVSNTPNGGGARRGPDSAGANIDSASAVTSAAIDRNSSASSLSSASSGPSLPPHGATPKNGLINHSSQSAVTASPGVSDIEMNNRLKEIFDMIGDPSNSRLGIQELYDFQKAYPEAGPRVKTWMSKTGNYFQTYLKRALENLASAERERNGFSAAADMESEPPPTPNQSSTLTSDMTPRRGENPSGVPSRSSRFSVGGAAAVTSTTPGQAAKLQELQSMFGFSSQAEGQMPE